MKLLARINWAFATLVILLGLTLKIVCFPFMKKPYASKLSAWFIRTLMGIRVKVVGKIDPKAQLLIINHQSELDIAIIETLTGRNLAWVAKKELFEVPFFSLALRLSKEIPLERESKSALVSLLKTSKERLEAGRTICIFPEGTRSESGRMRPFKPGAKLLAEQLELTVQPVVLIDTAEHFSTKRLQARPGCINAVWLESFVAPRDNQEWLTRLHDTMQATYDDYSAEAKRRLTKA